MLTRTGTVAALGALSLISGCAAFSCLGPHEPNGEWTTAELVGLGNGYLESALALPPLSFPYQRASACFLRARQISADDFGVNLGLGVSYLSLAKIQANKGEKAKAALLLSTAKKALGTAYLVRQGHMEALYYLAEVALVENTAPSLRLAQLMLEHLEKAHYKPGPVYVLLGFLAEKNGNRQKARPYYNSAMEQSWPPSTVSYATERYLELGK